MNYLSACSGIGCDTLAAPENWHCIGHSEIAPFPAAVLDHRWPSVTNFGDLNDYQNWKLPAQPDIIVGGTPCQSFSTAGTKRGLDDPRGQLTIKYFEMVAHFRPRWFIWENVPNALNTALPPVINEITERGYCCAWRILDSLGFGVPQRRRRLFVVGYLGDRWQKPASVLFDGARGGWVPKARDAGKDASEVQGSPDRVYQPHRIDRRIDGRPYAGTLQSQMGERGNSVPMVYHPHGNDCRIDEGEATGTLTATMGEGGGNVPIVYSQTRQRGRNEFSAGDSAGTLMASMHKSDSKPIVYCPGAANQNRNVGGAVHKQDHLGCLDTKGGVGGATKAVVYCPGGSNRKGAVHEQDYMSSLDTRGAAGGAAKATVYASQRFDSCKESDNATTLRAHVPDCTHADIHYDQGGLRFLTPEECERLMGIPTGHTRIPWRGRPAEECPNGHRYRAIGNGMVVDLARWLFGRIDFVDGISSSQP